MVKRKSQCSIRATVRGKVDFCFSRRRVKKAEVLVRGTVEVSESDGDRPPLLCKCGERWESWRAKGKIYGHLVPFSKVTKVTI